MFGLAEILRGLKEKRFYLCTPCTCWLIAVGLMFGLNGHQHKQIHRITKNTSVTQLLPTCNTPVHCLHTHTTLPLSVVNTRSAVRYSKALCRYKLSLPETRLQLCSTWLQY